MLSNVNDSEPFVNRMENVLPEVNVPVLVKGTLSNVPGQTDGMGNAWVVMVVWANPRRAGASNKSSTGKERKTEFIWAVEGSYGNRRFNTKLKTPALKTRNCPKVNFPALKTAKLAMNIVISGRLNPCIIVRSQTIVWE